MKIEGLQSICSNPSCKVRAFTAGSKPKLPEGWYEGTVIFRGRPKAWHVDSLECVADAVLDLTTVKTALEKHAAEIPPPSKVKKAPTLKDKCANSEELAGTTFMVAQTRVGSIVRCRVCGRNVKVRKDGRIENHYGKALETAVG